MNVDTFQVFCDVIETKSFSKAASRNRITQSAVSQQVRALEQRYGARLIDRVRGRAEPTASGAIFYRASRDIATRLRRLDDELERATTAVAGDLRIATVHSVGVYELADPLRRFLAAHPHVHVALDYRRANEIHEDVLSNAVDLGIIAYPTRRPHLTVVPFRQDRLVLACPPDHRLARSRVPIEIRELDGERFVGFDRKIPTRRAIDRIFRERGIHVDYVTEVDNIDTIKRLVEIGQGVALVPEPGLEAEVRSGTLAAVRIADDGLLRPLAVIRRKERELLPAAARFIGFLTGELE